MLPWREHTPEALDYLVFDLDLAEQPLASAVRLALPLRELPEASGRCGYPKTGGERGPHVPVPLGGAPPEVGRLLAELRARLVQALHPELGTVERRVSRRGPRVFLDTGQIGRSRAIVAPYSVRAVPEATVSTPLGREEVRLALDPRRFSLTTVRDRVQALGDPWERWLDAKPDRAQVLELLRGQLGV